MLNNRNQDKSSFFQKWCHYFQTKNNR